MSIDYSYLGRLLGAGEKVSGIATDVCTPCRLADGVLRNR
jgi:hypothetical protein